MYRVILIDDEQAATDTLERNLKRFTNVEVIGCYNHAEQGIEAIIDLAPDIVFLDIEMPVKNGFEVAKATEHVSYHLVFVTAYVEHALTAFDTKVIDYLVKPVRPSRLDRCMEKIQQLDMKEMSSEPSDLINVYDGQTRHRLTAADICFIESIGRYQQINLTLRGVKKLGLKTIVTEETMANYELQLDSAKFMRVHRSYIINLTMISQLHREGKNMSVTLTDASRTIPVSRSKSALLNNYIR